MLQSSRVVWKSFSISYSTKKTRRYDVYTLPLQNVCGQIRTDNHLLDALSIQLRFKYKPRPKSVKIYGISTFEVRNIKELETNLRRCEAAFSETFSVEDTSIKDK